MVYVQTGLIYGLNILTVILYFALPTALWKRTPGKFILRLKVRDYRGKAPGIWRALGRETLKLLAIACPLGMLFCLFQILNCGSVWYDNLCGTDVDHSSFVKLTPAQKNWCKMMKQQQKQQ
ncbi:MAG: RDD family protein [Lentisphaerae bacterium]|nr:RDD family protein [Lentisphaerota bacterium]MCP4102068.1 RDD family protein [Lentisphaerota bacterium]